MKNRLHLWERLARANPVLISISGLALAVLLRVALTPLWKTDNAYITFYPAIMFSTVAGGWKHGLFAAIASTLIGYIIILDMPRLSLDELAALIIFLSVNLLMISFTEMITRTRRQAEVDTAAAVRRAEAARLALEARQQLNEALRASRVAALNLMEDAIEERRKAEQLSDKLRESEERMQEALRVSHSFTFEWDLRSDRMSRSASCEEILNLNKKHLTEDSGKNYFKRVHPNDLERLKTLQRELRPGNDRYSTKYRIVRSDNNITVLEESARGYFDAGGVMRRLIGVCTDVTAREKAEEERQKFVSLADSSQEFVGMCDYQFNPFYINAAGLKMVGLDSLEAACRFKIQDFFFPDDQPFITKEFFPRVLRKGSDEVEIRFRHFKTGEALWMLYNVFNIRNASGAVVGWATVSRNIDARKRAEEALREATKRERFLADVIDNADIAFCAGAADGRLIMCNRAFTELTGYRRNELMKPDFNLSSVLTPPEWRKIDAEQQDYAIRTRLPVRYEKEYLCKDGMRIPVELFVQPIFNESGNLLHFRAFATDITERKKAEDALYTANRRKDEFLATLAHELRNPLAPLRNALEMLRHRNNADPALTRMRDMMERQVSQLTRLVDDLLEVSRITSGKIELRLALTTLSIVVNDAVESCRPFIDAGKHHLTVNLPQTPVNLYVDAARITQVLANLLINAAKFTPGGGRIELSAETDQSQDGASGLVLCVRDNGMGVSNEMRERIFDMFAQAEKSGNGLGIGLTLVRKLVELHGGDISVHSGGTGRGSEFRIWLPPACLAETQPPAEEKPFADSAMNSGRRILVVDDNRDAADSLAALLEVLGWQVHKAYNGPEGLDQVTAWRPELVFLDIGMEGMDGCEVARRIRAETDNNDITLVALTGWGQEDIRQETHAAGFTHHLVKPVDIKLLEEVLADFK